MSGSQLGHLIDRAVFPGLQGGPHNQTTAGIAVCLQEACSDGFRNYARQVVANAKALAESLIERGYDLVSGGTDNHLVLIDLTSRGLLGKPAAKSLDRAGLVANYNTIPFDARKPFDPSGLRLGTPAVTTRGMGTDEMRTIARWVDEALAAASAGDEEVLDRIAEEVRELARAYPPPGGQRLT